MKTAATVLQEMMVKLGKTPEYECISQKGPQHLAMFEYRCTALGVSVTASARSKKEAKQEVARLMLAALASQGHSVPSPYSVPPRTPLFTCEAEQDTGQASAVVGSYVAKLRDLCEEYRLPAVDYELIGDTGPAHMRQFTMKATLGKHTRIATSTTKKAARQLAAQQLYKYLLDNLAIVKDFVEEEALVRSDDHIMERYCEAREDAPWRPDLGQRMDTCYRTVLQYIDSEKREKALDALKALNESEERRRQAFEALGDTEFTAEETSVEILERIAKALGLTVNYSEIPAEFGTLSVISLTPSAPELVFAGKRRVEAARNALTFLELSLDAGIDEDRKVAAAFYPDSPMTSVEEKQT